MPDQILRLPAVEERVGLKRTAIYQRMDAGEFPKPIALGRRARGWRSSDIEKYVATLHRAERWRPSKGKLAEKPQPGKGRAA